MAALYFFQVTVARRIVSGPYAPQHELTGLLGTPCKENWWSYFLYIQNYVSPKNMVNLYENKGEDDLIYNILVFSTYLVCKCGYAIYCCLASNPTAHASVPETHDIHRPTGSHRYHNNNSNASDLF